MEYFSSAGRQSTEGTEENKLKIHLPTPPENVTTLTFELQNFFI